MAKYTRTLLFISFLLSTSCSTPVESIPTPIENEVKKEETFTGPKLSILIRSVEYRMTSVKIYYTVTNKTDSIISTGCNASIKNKFNFRERSFRSPKLTIYPQESKMSAIDVRTPFDDPAEFELIEFDCLDPVIQ
jgi:hypothetical protein